METSFTEYQESPVKSKDSKKNSYTSHLRT